MDKTVTFAVAGSGKTRSIVEQIDPSRRSLVITYTTNTEEDLRRRIANKLDGRAAAVTVDTYFSFLNRFCYKPFLQTDMRSRGISFSAPSKATSRMPLSNRLRYMHGDRIYHSRMAKLLEVRGCLAELRERLDRYYDDIYVDEVQDFGGHDFNFLLEIARARARFRLVGDFYQHTFATSHDGNVNKSLHDNYEAYRLRFAKAGFHVDTTTLGASHRCGPAVCNQITRTLGIQIASAGATTAHVEVVESQTEVDRLHSDPATVKLFLEQHWLYGCSSHNWGACKGLDHYQDVCVALNPTSWTLFSRGQLAQAKPMIRNKLYVAFSRARGNLYLAPERLFKKHRQAE
ncbi:Viral (Superfamily 1) RNA helicase [Burkholderia pseudomallei]|nr:Viral (Superfamily 1) RNA helicase [Burkholderia pseudomallei]